MPGLFWPPQPFRLNNKRTKAPDGFISSSTAGYSSTRITLLCWRAQPFKRENKRTKARDAARAADAQRCGDAATHSSASDIAAEVGDEAAGGISNGSNGARQPQTGDLIEYPLSELHLQIGRRPLARLLPVASSCRCNSRTVCLSEPFFSEFW